LNYATLASITTAAAVIVINSFGVIQMDNNNQSTKQELNLVPLVAIFAPLATMMVVAMTSMHGLIHG